VGQQFGHFGDVGILPGLVEQIQEFLQGVGIVAHVADDGVQALEYLVRVLCQQALGVLIVDL
jgi:hypothetical protein